MIDTDDAEFKKKLTELCVAGNKKVDSEVSNLLSELSNLIYHKGDLTEKITWLNTGIKLQKVYPDKTSVECLTIGEFHINHVWQILKHAIMDENDLIKKASLLEQASVLKEKYSILETDYTIIISFSLVEIYGDMIDSYKVALKTRTDQNINKLMCLWRFGTSIQNKNKNAHFYHNGKAKKFNEEMPSLLIGLLSLTVESAMTPDKKAQYFEYGFEVNEESPDASYEKDKVSFQFSAPGAPDPVHKSFYTEIQVSKAPEQIVRLYKAWEVFNTKFPFKGDVFSPSSPDIKSKYDQALLDLEEKGSLVSA